jgi:hypothetical protein
MTLKIPSAKNQYGLDTPYFVRWLNRIIPSLDRFKPDEFAREFGRMAAAADKEALLADQMPSHSQLEQQRDLLRTQNNQLVKALEVAEAFIKKVENQTPEKPDYWSSCGQCASNSSEAEDVLAALAAAKGEGGVVESFYK